ncbi:MAG: hypothetical protein E6I03_11025 [Chloroflexi bacterium]|nr:MAG: hypothetical protein E6I03_11025 [Chloroflexota bacterium]
MTTPGRVGQGHATRVMGRCAGRVRRRCATASFESPPVAGGGGCLKGTVQRWFGGHTVGHPRGWAPGQAQE